MGESGCGSSERELAWHPVFTLTPARTHHACMCLGAVSGADGLGEGATGPEAMARACLVRGGKGRARREDAHSAVRRNGRNPARRQPAIDGETGVEREERSVDGSCGTARPMQVSASGSRRHVELVQGLAETTMC